MNQQPNLIAFIPASVHPHGVQLFLDDMASNGHTDEALFQKQAINYAHENGWRADEVEFEYRND